MKKYLALLLCLEMAGTAQIVVSSLASSGTCPGCVQGAGGLTTPGLVTVVGVSGSAAESDISLASGIFSRAGALGLSATGANSVSLATNSVDRLTFDGAGAGTLQSPLNYGVDSGSTDAYVCTLSPAISAYKEGNSYRCKANTANTGAATVDFGPGAVAIKTAAGADPATGDIRAGQMVDVVYTATSVMQMQSARGNNCSANGPVNVTCPPFNAVGDGVANDTTAFQAAITAAGTTSKGVYVPAGTYLLTVLTFTDGITVTCDSAVLKQAQNTHNQYIFNWYARKNMTVRGCTFDGDRANQPVPGVGEGDGWKAIETGSAASNILIDNCHFLRFYDKAVALQYVNGATVQNSTFSDNYNDGVYIYADPDPSSNIRITNSRFYNSTRAGITIDYNPTGIVNAVVIDKCTFAGTDPVIGGTNASMVGVYARLGMKGIAVQNSNFSDLYAGVWLRSTVEDVNISENDFHNLITYGVLMSAEASDYTDSGYSNSVLFNNARIANNHFHNIGLATSGEPTNTAAISIATDAVTARTVSRISIEGNRISETRGTKYMNYAVRFVNSLSTSRFDTITFRGNVMRGAKLYNLSMYGTSPTATAEFGTVLLDGEIYQDADSHGAVVLASHDVTVRDSTFRDNGRVAASQTGLYLDADRGWLLNNRFYNTSTIYQARPYWYAGTGITAINNYEANHYGGPYAAGTATAYYATTIENGVPQIPSAKYSVVKIANGAGGCANAKGCWSVNGGTAVNAATATTQTLTWLAAPAAASLNRLQLKTATACAGITAITISQVGTTASATEFAASLTYDLKAAVAATNLLWPALSTPGLTAAATNWSVTVSGGAENIDDITNGCAFDIRAQWSVGP